MQTQTQFILMKAFKFSIVDEYLKNKESMPKLA